MSRRNQPDRWHDYCPMGSVIPNTRFLACKVPLKEALLRGVNEEEKFSPDILMARLEEQGSKLGMVIDLTNTQRYYDYQEFEKNSVAYKKIFVKGARSGETVPNDEKYLEFAAAVNKFSQDSSDDEIIAVHCTHGLNRSGYLICRYMIEEMDFEPSEAINSFNTSRKHVMEREAYTNDLLERKTGEKTVKGQNPSNTERQNGNQHDRRHNGARHDRRPDRPHSGRHDSRPYNSGGQAYSQDRYQNGYNRNQPFPDPYQQAGWGTSSSHRGSHRGWRDREDYDHHRHDNSRGRGRNSHWHNNYHQGAPDQQFSDGAGYYPTHQGFHSDRDHRGHRGRGQRGQSDRGQGYRGQGYRGSRGARNNKQLSAFGERISPPRFIPDSSSRESSSKESGRLPYTPL